jgi:hypothetical protein
MLRFDRSDPAECIVLGINRHRVICLDFHREARAQMDRILAGDVERVDMFKLPECGRRQTGLLLQLAAGRLHGRLAGLDPAVHSLPCRADLRFGPAVQLQKLGTAHAPAKDVDIDNATDDGRHRGMFL